MTSQALNISLKRTEDSKTNQEQFAKFTKILHRGGKLAYTWTRYEGASGGDSYWWEVEKEPPPKLIGAPKGLHVYFSVHPLAVLPTTNKSGDPAEPHRVRGRVEHVAAINCLFADMDVKDFESPAAFKQHLKSLTPVPSVVVHTGYGAHAYWLLDEPFPIYESESNRSRAQQLQYAWTEYTGSDPNAKDLARILRAPGSINWKYGKQVRAKFLRYKLEQTYSIDELEKFVDPELLKTAPAIEIKPIQDIEHETAKASRALELLKPWRADERESWVEIGMALSQLGDAGFRLWDEWSQQSDKYDEEDCERKWKSFSSAEVLKDRKPVTLSTLYYHAREDAADFSQEDETTLIGLLDEATDPTSTIRQRRAAKEKLFERLEWYPSDIYNEIRSEAKRRKWLKTDFDQAFEDFQSGSGSVASGEDSDEVKSLLLAQAWLRAYPDTAWVDPEWYRFVSGIWVYHPENKIHREMTEYALDMGIVPEAHIVKNAVFFARAYTPLQWGPNDWNPDPNIVIVENGALDISSYPPQLEDWSPEHRNLVKLPVEYDPTAKAPTYLRALIENLRVPNRPTEAKEVAKFLMRFAGLALAEVSDYEISPWLYGAAGGGKSTILSGIIAVLGNYAANVHLGRLDSYAHGLAAIVDKKLIFAFESDSRFLKNPGVLNAIISHEPVAINPKNRPEFNYDPRCAVLFAMNEVPGTANPESGIFRRVKVVTVPPRPTDLRDPSVRAIIENDRTERSGILNLMLRGLDEVRKAGALEIPDSVQEKTLEWHLANDKVGTFIRKRCIVKPNAEIAASELYKEFKKWCRIVGAKPYGQLAFGKRMTSLGFQRRKSGTTIYDGLEMRDEKDFEIDDEIQTEEYLEDVSRALWE